MRVSQVNTAGENFVCLPGAKSDLSQCYFDLAADKLGFEPTIIPDSHPPAPNDQLTCTVEDAVYLFTPVRGVKFTAGMKETPRVLINCLAAKALAATVDDLITQNVASIEFLKTVKCEVITSTGEVSRHGHGDAIDLAAFTLDDGTVYTLLADWEHDVTTPVTPGGKMLYEAAYRWHNASIWNVILTPNYNAAHDDHFHLDLTPNLHFIK